MASETPPPQINLHPSNLEVSDVRNQNITESQYRQHRRQFMSKHTLEAVEITEDPQGNKTNAQLAAERSYGEWKNIAIKVLGQNYGKTKLHHVILNTMADIESNMKQQIATSAVSVTHPNWVWNFQSGIVTFVWDESVDGYRYYVYKHLAVLECVFLENKGKKVPMPVSIKFIAYEQTIVNANPNDPYVEDVVEKFDEDFENWRANTYYIY